MTLGVNMETIVFGWGKAGYVVRFMQKKNLNTLTMYWYTCVPRVAYLMT